MNKTLTMAALLCASLTVACGDKITNIYSDDDDTTAGVGGSGGQGGSDLGGAGGVDQSGGAGGMGGQGGAGEGGMSEGGAGGMAPEPLCPAPSCIDPNTADEVINCDVACGALHPACAAVCDHDATLPIHAIGYGVTKIQLPPLGTQHPNCASECGATGPQFAMRFSIPDQNCVTFDGPVGSMIYRTFVQPGDESGLCSWGSGIMGCHSAAVANHPNSRYGVGVVNEPHPDAGGVITLTMLPSGCPQELCNGGCNGDGGMVMEMP